MPTIRLTLKQLEALLEDAAERGIKTGRRYADGPMTALAIAGRVYDESGLRPTEDEEQQ